MGKNVFKWSQRSPIPSFEAPESDFAHGSWRPKGKSIELLCILKLPEIVHLAGVEDHGHRQKFVHGRAHMFMSFVLMGGGERQSSQSGLGLILLRRLSLQFPFSDLSRFNGRGSSSGHASQAQRSCNAYTHPCA